MLRRSHRSPLVWFILLVALATIMTIIPERYRKLIEPTAHAANFTVNTADDHNDGACTVADCSLRDAITAVNAGAGGDTISFNIPGAGVQTINVNGGLGGLSITKTVTIDGTTQPGFGGTPLIELNGNAAGGVAGLNIAASGVTVKGLIINRFTGIGININGGSATIQGNFIGTNPSGTSALGNGTGIKIDGSSSCTIGGTTAATRNIISGNNGDGVLIVNGGSNNIVQGNYIGVDVTGTAAVSNTGNSLGGVNITGSNNNTIGGSAAGAGNVLSGNTGANAFGIQLNSSSNTTVQGNIIGLNAGATAAIQNNAGGMIVGGGVGTIIGGSTAGARNVISGNGGAGMILLTDSAQVKGNFIGTNGTGTAGIKNGSYGVLINGGDNIVVGGTTASDRNVISGSVTGVAIVSGGNNNTVQGNFIGTDVSGINGIGNGDSQPGIFIDDSNNNLIGGTAAGAGNVIAFNQGRGITVNSNSTGVSILGNSIFSNTDLGIDLGTDGPTPNDNCDADTGANNKQNTPALTTITPGATNTTIAGTINSTANTQYRIEFFVSTTCDPSGSGEGQVFLGSTNVTTDASCSGNFQLIVPNASLTGSVVTATATDPNGNTSEFSSCVPLGIAPTNTVQFSAANFNVTEACTGVTLTINRSGDTTGSATVKYATSDITASERNDYITSIGTLSFAPGETSKTLVILINDDAKVEGAETLSVTLSNPTSVNLGTPATATVTIADNASEPATNPNDDPQTYVCQHYHDFLNREPDPGGLAFWTNEITSCGNNAQCIDVKRINVSAAFYLSIEFQQTGYLVERVYKASFGDVNGTSTFPNNHTLRVPIMRFKEFLPDTQQISKGVIVGQGNWEQQLDTNKSAFTAEFVQRGPFITAFPTLMTPAQFVDKLIQNSGSSPTGAERTAAIDEFAGSVDSSNVAARGRALRRVAEVPSFQTLEFNRAFVLMQYFGYLRRNTNDSPDSDYTGYDFWLTKLNQFNGNFVNAEMVKAFIQSDEYRKRFGP